MASRVSRVLVLLTAVCGLGGAGALAVAAPAAADVVWLCKPGESPNPCEDGGDATTVQEADGSSSVPTPSRPAPVVDCFYVYPTVSEQPGVSSNKDKDDSVVAIAKYQAAYYSSRCRVFAPVYRQRTLAGILSASPEQSRAAGELAYGDVLEAWRQYLAQDNGGRGVVLIGHSQGTGVLRRLVREQIDPDPAARAKLVSAILLGGNVAVRRGSDRGGDFQQVPACRSDTQTGCVMAWSTFDHPVPNPSRFGRTPATADGQPPGTPAGPEFEVLCTNPVSLGANDRGELASIVATEPYPGIIGAGLLTTYGGAPPTADTPFVRPGERYTGRCESGDGANVLQLERVGAARDLNDFPDATWGLHLTDANIALGDLVGVVGRQAAAYEAARAGGTATTTTPAPMPAPFPAAPGAPALVPRPTAPSAAGGRVRPVVTTTSIARRARGALAVRVRIGATQGRRCDGRLRLTAYAPGGRRAVRRTVAVPGCTVARRLVVPRRLAGRLVRVSVSYLGGTQLDADSAPSRRVTTRR